MEQLCAVWYGKHDLRLERRAVPALGPREVLVEVALTISCSMAERPMHGSGWQLSP
jgi:hypothetical protein